MSRKKKIILLTVAVVGIAAAAAWFFIRPKEVTNYDVEFEQDQIKPEDGNSASSEGEGIRIPGYKSVEIQAGTKNVAVELTNPEENQVYFRISFYLPETDETIYTSKMIKPGQSLYEITLDKEMEAGEYPLTIQYETFTMDEGMSPRNGAEVNCTLKVK